ncbi:hypothetical protein ACFVHI_00030 [Kitasatospora sp. NPDC127121]|uniref:hypothetical protein n=1 Tax=Kitasatospora sp. NPDC127121 TaxID=3345371 RepID=UPI00362F5B51
MAQRRYEYAPAGTLPGLLQRGRGLGAQMAAEDPAAAAELVYGCIRWDWRWDREADDRHLYLARLVRDLELPVGPIVDLLTGDEDTCLRATGVLELLALGGSAEAREALRTHVREGEHRVAVLESVATVWPTPWWEDLAAGQDVREWRGPRALLPEHGGASDLHIASDLPTATGELERQWASQEWCGPMHTARGLARFGPDAAGAASLLRRFWLWTPHSSERPAYLEALAAVAPVGLAEVYTECLWDCEAGARLPAVAHAPDRPHVRERLAHLRDDPMEEAEVREAAGARLAGLSSGGSEPEGAGSEGELE